MDQEVTDVSAHLRRERSKTLPTSLLSQLRALPQFWGSRGRRFESCRPDGKSAGQGPNHFGERGPHVCLWPLNVTKRHTI